MKLRYWSWSCGIAVIALGVNLSAALAVEKRSPDTDAAKSVARALDFLQQDTVKWRTERQCATCHHGVMTVWTLNEAKTRGFSVDSAFLADTTAWTKARLDGIAKPRDPRPGWNMISTYALYLSVGSQNQPRQTTLSSEELKAIADHAGRHLEADGSTLTPATMEPPRPINGPPPTWESREVLTLFAALAMHPGANAELAKPGPAQEGRTRALRYLTGMTPGRDNQTEALRLLLALQEKNPKEAIRKSLDGILARQNSDGGWSQTPGLPSDAYATGQSLYVLNLAGVERKRKEIRSAVSFLLATQREDGSWPMTRRGHPGVTPGAFTQPIIYFGSAWGTIGLVRSVSAK